MFLDLQTFSSLNPKEKLQYITTLPLKKRRRYEDWIQKPDDFYNFPRDIEHAIWCLKRLNFSFRTIAKLPHKRKLLSRLYKKTCKEKNI